MNSNESVDGYLADLHRPSTDVWWGVSDHGLACVFVAGLSEHVMAA